MQLRVSIYFHLPQRLHYYLTPILRINKLYLYLLIFIFCFSTAPPLTLLLPLNIFFWKSILFNILYIHVLFYLFLTNLLIFVVCTAPLSCCCAFCLFMELPALQFHLALLYSILKLFLYVFCEYIYFLLCVINLNTILPMINSSNTNPRCVVCKDKNPNHQIWTPHKTLEWTHIMIIFGWHSVLLMEIRFVSQGKLFRSTKMIISII